MNCVCSLSLEPKELISVLKGNREGPRITLTWLVVDFNACSLRE